MKIEKKAALFDLDGVLFDSEYTAARYYVEDSETVGMPLPFDEILSYAGMSHQEFDRMTDKLLEPYGGISELNRRIASLPEREIPFADLVYPHVPELLSLLKEKGYKIAVCSASPASYVKKALEEGKIDKYVDYVISGHDLPVSKPDPAIYLKAMNVLGVEPENSFVIEDSSYGIEAGKRAGCLVVAHHDSKYRYDQSQADIIVDDYQQLMEILS